MATLQISAPEEIKPPVTGHPSPENKLQSVRGSLVAGETDREVIMKNPTGSTK